MQTGLLAGTAVASGVAAPPFGIVALLAVIVGLCVAGKGWFDKHNGK